MTPGGSSPAAGKTAVLVYPLAHPVGEDILNSAGITTVVLDDDQPATIAGALGDAHAVILRGPARLTGDMLAEARHLEVIGALGAGTDNIDLGAASRHGVTVVSGAGVAPDAVAEFAIAAAVAAHRDLLAMHQAMVEGRVDWNSRLADLAGTELTGSTFGVLGLGNIGRAVARKARGAFDARVVAYDPFLDPTTVPTGVELLPKLDDVFDAATTVSVHSALTEDSRGMVGRHQLELLGPAGVLVNAARGGIVDEDALVEALTGRRIRGAVLDVFAAEPPPPDWIARLGTVPGLLLTPHMAGVTTRSQEALCGSVATEVLAVLEGRPSARAVVAPR